MHYKLNLRCSQSFRESHGPPGRLGSVRVKEAPWLCRRSESARLAGRQAPPYRTAPWLGRPAVPPIRVKEGVRWTIRRLAGRQAPAPPCRRCRAADPSLSHRRAADPNSHYRTADPSHRRIAHPSHLQAADPIDLSAVDPSRSESALSRRAGGFARSRVTGVFEVRGGHVPLRGATSSGVDVALSLCQREVTSLRAGRPM